MIIFQYIDCFKASRESYFMSKLDSLIGRALGIYENNRFSRDRKLDSNLSDLELEIQNILLHNNLKSKPVVMRLMSGKKLHGEEAAYCFSNLPSRKIESEDGVRYTPSSFYAFELVNLFIGLANKYAAQKVLCDDGSMACEDESHGAFIHKNIAYMKSRDLFLRKINEGVNVWELHLPVIYIGKERGDEQPIEDFEPDTLLINSKAFSLDYYMGLSKVFSMSRGGVRWGLENQCGKNYFVYFGNDLVDQTIGLRSIPLDDRMELSFI